MAPSKPIHSGRQAHEARLLLLHLLRLSPVRQSSDIAYAEKQRQQGPIDFQLFLPRQLVGAGRLGLRALHVVLLLLLLLLCLTLTLTLHV
jgi:hypothetical protein